MKLSYKDIEPFIKKPDGRARAILIYGPDNGLVRERADLIGKTIVADLNDPFNVTVFKSDDLIDDTARLKDEAMALSMMGGARLIRIEGASDKITTVLKDYLLAPSAENLVVLEAGELGPRSSLRMLFEKSEQAAALPCYVDDERAITQLVRSILSEQGYTIQSDALSWLSMNIAGDRMRIRSEMEKLTLYMGAESKTVTLADVMASCGEGGAQSFDDLIYAIGGGKAETALFTYNKLLGEGTPVVQIMRILQNHFRRLHFTKSMMSKGMGADEAMGKLQPAIFFKNQPAFRAQLSKWPQDRLLSILDRLSQVEAQMKKTGVPAETLGSQVVLSLAA